MKVTGLCAVMAAVMAATTTFAAPLPTGLEAGRRSGSYGRRRRGNPGCICQV